MWDPSERILRRRLREEAGIDLDDVPALLRERDIVSSPEHKGILPMTRNGLRTAIAHGYIAKPIPLGVRTIAWRRMDILKVLLDGTARAKQRPRTAAPYGRGGGGVNRRGLPARPRRPPRAFPFALALS